MKKINNVDRVAFSGFFSFDNMLVGQLHSNQQAVEKEKLKADLPGITRRYKRQVHFTKLNAHFCLVSFSLYIL